jgi:hypothetical protein
MDVQFLFVGWAIYCPPVAPTIISLKAAHMKKPEFDVLMLTWRIDEASPGRDTCQDNPLARATKNLFSNKGQPFKRINKSFFVDPSGCLRWMGIFVYSAGDRVLFFPGFSNKHKNLVGYKKDSLWKDVAMELDHISLEKDHLSWHVTNSGSTEHIGKIFTQELSDEARFWFSLSVSSIQDLRIVKEETIVSSPTPQDDTQRRIDIFTKARESAIFNILSLNNECQSLKEPSFIVFTVLIGKPGFSVPEDTPIGIPDARYFIVDGAEPREKNFFRGVRAGLTEAVEIVIMTSAHAGRLKNNFVYNGFCAGGSGSQVGKTQRLPT